MIFMSILQSYYEMGVYGIILYQAKYEKPFYSNKISPSNQNIFRTILSKLDSIS